MFFKIKKPEDILEFPEFPAEIVRIKKGSTKSEDLLYYRFYVNVDMTAAVKNDALSLSVDVYKKKPPTKTLPKKVRRAGSWKKKTKRLESNAIRARKVRLEKRIAHRNIDITKYLSNDLANLKKSLDAASQYKSLAKVTRTQRNSLVSQTKIVSLSDPFTMSAKSSYKPTTAGVLKKSGKKKTGFGSKKASSTVIQGVRVNPPTMKSFSSSAISIKKDPAAFSASTQNSFSKGSFSKVMRMKTADIVFTPPRSLPSMAVFRAIPSKKMISFVVRMKRKQLTDTGSFYLSLELENSKGVKVDDAGSKINHATILNSFLTPNSLPKLEAEYVKPGIVSVSLTKPREKSGISPISKAPRFGKTTRMKVFRRISSATEGSTSSGSPWVEIFDETIEDSDTYIFRDRVATSKPLLYRAVCYGENAKPSEKFASTIVLPLKQFKKKQDGALTALARIIVRGSNNFVTVSVKDIPHDVVVVMVKRFNKTYSSDADRKASKGAGFVYIGDSPATQQVLVKDIDDDGTASFLDETSKAGNNYIYVPVGVTRSGKEITGSSAVVEVPYSPERAKVALNVGRAVFSADDMSVVFDLKARFTDFGFSEIRRALGAGQQANLFSSDLLEDRDKFESLINFLVERENSKTGAVESFGVYNSGQFSDDEETRLQKNISSLEPGIEYMYTTTALISTPETLFSKLKRPEVDLRTLRPFARNIAKFQNTLSLNRATLASTQRQKNSSLPSALEPSDPIVAGRTNIQDSKEVRIPITASSKPEIRIENHKRFNRVVWLSSDVDRIDHFRVYVLSSGGRVLLDTVHCDTDTSEFYYRHFEKDYGVEYQYMIQPIDLNYREMPPIFTKPVKKKTFQRAFGISLSSRLERL